MPNQTGDNPSDPSYVELYPGEEVQQIDLVPFVVPDAAPTLERLICDLTGVDSIDEVGNNGMAIASKAYDKTLGEGAYQAHFARDALVMAALTEDVLPRLSEATVMFLAERQGVHDVGDSQDPIFDVEEVGRIPHEMRKDTDPMVRFLTDKHGWTWPYFGSVDATALFTSTLVRAIHRDASFLERSVGQRDGVVRTMAEVLHRALVWMLANCDDNPLGFLSAYAATNNAWQVWADSQDPYHHPDGVLASGDIAAVEVQAVTYDALMEAAAIYETHSIEDSIPSDVLRSSARRLQKNVIEKMWVDEKGGYFASAYQHDSDGYTGPLRVRTGNSALPLHSSILDGPEHRPLVEALVKQITDKSSPLVCPSGIRTLASDEVRFRACGYHTGSVWPWQNYWIALGLRRHGFSSEADAIEARMARINAVQECFPEYVQGHDTEFAKPNEASVCVMTPDGHGRTFEQLAMQPAQKFQGWTAFGTYAVENRQGSGGL